MDLEKKLGELKTYYNEFRVHQSLAGTTPAEKGGGSKIKTVGLDHYCWRSYCHGLFQLPMAA
jgi:putative transposase